MEPGSPEWIEKTVEELEYLENARESLANAPVGNGSVPTEGARQAQLAAFDHRIATLFAELEPFAGDEEESTDAGDPLPAMSTALPVAGGSTSTQPAVTTPEANAFDDDPFAVPSFSAPAVQPAAAVPSFDQELGSEDSAAFGSGLGSDYGDALNEGAPKKKKWVLPAVLGAVGVAACAVVIPMLGSSDAPQADPTLSQPAAAAIAPAATPTPVPEPEPAPPVEAAPAAENPVAKADAADNAQVAANTEKPAAEPEQAEDQESELEDWENPAVLKMRSPRGRKARRKAKKMKKREARRRRREAAAERRRNARSGGGDGAKQKGKKRRSKRRKPREEASAAEPSPKKRKRKRLDLGKSGDPLG